MIGVIFWLAVVVVVLLGLYLWHVNNALIGTPPEGLSLNLKPWTEDEIRKGYEKAWDSPTDVTPYLFSKKDRRYIVVGGSGLVGGWIVRHLLQRDEPASNIRIMDLRPPTMTAILQHSVPFIKVDVTDPASLSKAFSAPWPGNVELPLTVFHTVAYIRASDHTADFLPIYQSVNINGTANVIAATKAAGADIMIATSSGSVAPKRPSFFLAPWARWPRHFFQVLPNADPGSLDAPLGDFGSCYAWSKARAEKLVRQADEGPGKGRRLRTGCIRPAHAIYGSGMDNDNSLTWSYLRRGGSPTWIQNTIANLVDAQNVSIAHLAFEDRLLSPQGTDPGGKAYACTDPSPPIRYGDIYKVMSTLSHTPMSFPPVSPVMMLLVSYCVEAYILLQLRHAPWLPKPTGDLALVTPAMFDVCTLHLVFDDSRAREEIGYRAPISTLEGLCEQLVVWNRLVEERKRTGKAEVQANGVALPGLNVPVLNVPVLNVPVKAM